MTDAIPRNRLWMAEPLIRRAHRIAVERMAECGNAIKPDHKMAIRRTVEVFTEGALGNVQQRTVVDLPTGGGKTVSVVSWLAAIHDLNLDIAVVVAASQIEALITMIRDLGALGVPAEKIGLIHGKGSAASMQPTADNEDRAFLFVSHERIKLATGSSRREDVLTAYNERKRELVIWDEVLISSTSQMASVVDVRSLHAALGPQLQAAPDNVALKLAVDHLNAIVALLDAEIARQREGSVPVELRLPPLPQLAEEAYAKAVHRALRRFAPQADAIEMLFQGGGPSVRVALMGPRKEIIVSAEATIPASLKNIVVLDAGHRVNQLTQLDPTLVHDWWFAEDRPRPLKTYDQVTLYWRKGRSGRASMEAAFGDASDGTLQEIVRVVGDIPADEAILIFTFKYNPPEIDIPAKLHGALKDASIALTLPDGRPRIVILTWGKHTSLNEYSHAANVVFAGLLQRSEDDLVAAAIGQTGNLLAPLSDIGSPKTIVRCDVAGTVYQALSRGACRRTENGRALPMKVWLMHYDEELLDELRLLMPGLNAQPWDAVHLKDPKTDRATLAALQIELFLSTYDGSEISNREIKRRVGLSELTSSTFTRAVSLVDVEDWRRWKASFLRTDNPKYFRALGFEVEEGGFSVADWEAEND